MKISEVATQEARFKMTVVGVKEATADFGKMADAQEDAATAAEVLVKQEETVEKTITRLGSRMEAYTRSQLTPAAKALLEVEKGERLADAARREGMQVSERLLAAIESARGKYQKLSGAVNDNASAFEHLSDSMQKAAAMTATMSKAGGMSDPTAMTRRMSHSANEAAKAAGLARHEWVNLSRQGQDVAVSLYGGQSPLTVLAQQGGQIADVFTSSRGGATAALKEFGSVVTGFVLHPVTLLAGAVGALTLALMQFESQQTRLQRAVNGAGAFSGMTADQLRQAGLSGAAAGALSASQGIESAATLAGTGRIDGSLIPGLISRSQKYADAFGMDQADALKELAKAFSDPVEGAKQLDERLGFLDGRTKEYIQTLQEQGNLLGAQTVLWDRFDGSLEKTANTTWKLTEYWRLFKSGLMNPAQTVAGAIDQALITPKTPAQIAAEKATAARAAEEQKARRESIEITDRVTKFVPEVGSRKALSDSASFFNNAAGNAAALSKLGVSTTDFAKAQDIANVKLQNFATESEKVREATETRSRSMATLNERTKADVEAQQTYTDTLRDTGDRQLAAAKADAVRADALGRVNAAVRAYNDAAKEQLALAGMSPFQRSRAQIGIEAENFKKQYGVVPSGVADRYAALNKQFNYDAFGAPMQDIEGQRRMLGVQKAGIGKSTFDSSFDSAYMEKYNQLVKEGIEITPQAVEQMNAYARAHADLAVEAEKVNKVEQNFRDGLDITRSALKDLGSSLVDAFRRGESAANAMLGVLDRLTSKLLDKTLDMGIDALLGKSGSTGTRMLGGLLGGVGKLFGFANGGIMTSAGPLPLMTYANGGVADRPQLAMFGEGRKPEAYVPLPDGKRIPVAMQGQSQGGLNVRVINNVAGAQPEVRRMSDGELLITFSKMMKEQVPGIVANSQRRSM